MSKHVKLTHLKSILSLEVDWVWGHQPTSHLALNDKEYQIRPEHIKQDPKIFDKSNSFEHPKDLEVVPHPIIRNIHQTAPYSSSRLEN